MARKQTLLDLIRQGQTIEQTFYASLPDADKKREGKVDDWAAKDVMAHVAYWKQFRVANIQRILDGGSITKIDDFDHENALIFERFSDKSWEDVMAYAEESTAVLTAQLEIMDEDDLGSA